MLNWITEPIDRGLEQWAQKRNQQTQRLNGVFVEVALVLAEYTGPRQYRPRQCLGRTGHRDWTKLRASLRWSSEPDTNKLDAVLQHLVETTIEPSADFDIADVSNILLSKSNLASFPTMEAFENRMPNHEYGNGTQADLSRCLDHNEVRCLKGRRHGVDSASSFAWDSRLLLNNHGGSHHFSAARRIAKELKVNVALELLHEHHALNADVVREISESLALLVIPRDPDNPNDWNGVPGLLWDLKTALRREGVPFFRGEFRAPECYGEARVLPLPLTNDASAKAAKYLKACGFTDLVSDLVVDLDVQRARQGWIPRFQQQGHTA